MFLDQKHKNAKTQTYQVNSCKYIFLMNIPAILIEIMNNTDFHKLIKQI